MALDLVQIRVLAGKKEEENSRFRQFLKTGCRLDPSEIDQRVFETTRRVWAGIDCTTCGNCCREMNPSFSEEEVDRVAQRLGMERQQFIETYLERSEAGREKLWQTRATPCPFLKDNLCSIYEHRPADCSGYPYLYKADFVFRTMGMIGRTFTCPIVYGGTEELPGVLAGFTAHIKGGEGKNWNVGQVPDSKRQGNAFLGHRLRLRGSGYFP
ncbi:MAG: YkgJ family cysteine cluster protein [Candidatus Sulfotelmatobacter sp.]